MASDASRVMKGRIPQLDYLKGIFILLMVTFHLALVEHTYPVVREAVYTFHMSAFLIISGYLVNVLKEPAAMGKSLLRLVVPYVLFESLYIMAQYLAGGSLGSHNAISDLSASSFLLMVATQPTGPYWYLHTLVFCTAVYWLACRVIKRDNLGAIAITGVVLYGLTLMIEGLVWSNVLYFLIGISINRSGRPLMQVITPSWLALIPLAVLLAYPSNYDRGTLAGIAITVLVMSVLLALFPLCHQGIRRLLCYVGRNSLAIVVFSPIFTLAAKQASPYFAFDPTALCFTVVALTLVVTCCLASARLADAMKVSRYIFLKHPFYSPLRQS